MEGDLGCQPSLEKAVTELGLGAYDTRWACKNRREINYKEAGPIAERYRKALRKIQGNERRRAKAEQAAG